MSALTIDTAIAALKVSTTAPFAKTLKIKGVSAIPNEVQARDCPILFPSPSNWLAGSVAIPGNFDNPIAGRLEYRHTLVYVLAYDELGTGRGLSDHYAGMAALTIALQKAVIRQIDEVSVSIQNVAISSFGQMTDPSGKPFYGATVTITALEYVP